MLPTQPTRHFPWDIIMFIPRNWCTSCVAFYPIYAACQRNLLAAIQRLLPHILIYIYIYIYIYIKSMYLVSLRHFLFMCSFIRRFSPFMHIIFSRTVTITPWALLSLSLSLSLSHSLSLSQYIYIYKVYVSSQTSSLSINVFVFPAFFFFFFFVLIVLLFLQPGLKIGHHADNTLNSFCSWQSVLVGANGRQHDHAILLTGTDICSYKDEPCDTLGKVTFLIIIITFESNDMND